MVQLYCFWVTSHLPRSDVVYAYALLPGCLAQGSHQPPASKFRGIVLWASWLIKETSKTAFDYETAVSFIIFGLHTKIVHGKFCSIQNAYQIDVDDAQIGLDGLLRNVWRNGG